MGGGSTSAAFLWRGVSGNLAAFANAWGERSITRKPTTRIVRSKLEYFIGSSLAESSQVEYGESIQSHAPSIEVLGERAYPCGPWRSCSDICQSLPSCSGWLYSLSYSHFPSPPWQIQIPMSNLLHRGLEESASSAILLLWISTARSKSRHLIFQRFEEFPLFVILFFSASEIPLISRRFARHR